MTDTKKLAPAAAGVKVISAGAKDKLSRANSAPAKKTTPANRKEGSTINYKEGSTINSAPAKKTTPENRKEAAVPRYCWYKYRGTRA